MLTSASDKPIKCVCVTIDLNPDTDSEEISYSTILNNIYLSMRWQSNRLALPQRWVLNAFNWLMNETWTSHQAKIKNEYTDVNFQHFPYAQLMKHVECESSGKIHVKSCLWLHSTMIVWLCCANVLIHACKVTVHKSVLVKLDEMYRLFMK